MMDLKPYICVFPSCDKSQQTSRHSGDWITHMQSQHMPLEWTCIAHIHGTQTFDDAEAYIEHMKLAHVGIFADSQLPILAETSGRAGTQVFSMCPLCQASPEQCVEDDDDQPTGDAQGALQAHISQHLKSLALISLAWIEQSAASSTCSDLEHLLTLEERMEELFFTDQPDGDHGSERDTDLGDGSPTPDTSNSNDPAWTNWKDTHDSRDWCKGKKWAFCGDFPVLDNEDGDTRQDENLAGFVQEWSATSRMGQSHAKSLAGSIRLGRKRRCSLAEGLVGNR